jgi:hypothetical protein
MIYVLKIMWDYQVPLLELIVRNIARYPQSATSTPIHYQPAIRYLVPCSCEDHGRDETTTQLMEWWEIIYNLPACMERYLQSSIAAVYLGRQAPRPY